MLDVIWIPSKTSTFSVYAHAEFRGRSNRVHIGDAGIHLADVHETHVERASADGIDVRRRAWAKRANSGIHSDFFGDWTVDPHKRRSGARGHCLVPQVDVRIGETFDGGDDDRYMFRLASGHHACNRDLLDRRFTEAQLPNSNDLIRIAFGALEHSLNGFTRGREEWESVAPIIFSEQTVHLVESF